MSVPARKLLTDPEYKLDARLEKDDIETSGYDHVPPIERGQLLRAIGYLRQLEENWDGHGAPRLSELALATAEAFVKSIPLGKMFPTKVAPGMDHTICMEWHREDMQYPLFLSIDAAAITIMQVDDNYQVISSIESVLIPGQSILSSEIRQLMPSSRNG